MQIDFSIPVPSGGTVPGGTTVDPMGTTDEFGMVTTNLVAGTVVGSLQVRGVVHVNNAISALSPNIGIRGNKPANLGFKFTCSPVNVPAFVAPLPPASIDVACYLKLVDRYGNAVGGTTVGFAAEAGTLPSDVATLAYEYGKDNAKEGTASVTFNTYSEATPQDVDPLPADLNQFPNPRYLEPAVWSDPTYHTLVRNPRDGLVSLIAYVKGEEYFWDLNSDGAYGAGEPFIDQGEPFVDSNDNNQYDPGELYIDANGNNEYDAADGLWTDNATIWTETRVLFTGLVAALPERELPGRERPEVPGPRAGHPRRHHRQPDHPVLPRRRLHRRVQPAPSRGSPTTTSTA